MNAQPMDSQAVRIILWNPCGLNEEELIQSYRAPSAPDEELPFVVEGASTIAGLDSALGNDLALIEDYEDVTLYIPRKESRHTLSITSVLASLGKNPTEEQVASTVGQIADEHLVTFGHSMGEETLEQLKQAISNFVDGHLCRPSAECAPPGVNPECPKPIPTFSQDRLAHLKNMALDIPSSEPPDL